MEILDSGFEGTTNCISKTIFEMEFTLGLLQYEFHVIDR